jgi:radical SAM family uncharacterized protein/radical SAM-linked protein
VNIEELLPFVKKPSRYIGGEFNVTPKDWRRAEYRMALVFPDLYEIGMSHQGLQILYHIVNSRPEYLADRSFVPDIDMENMLRRHAMPLFSLESRRPLGEFDVIGITLPYELCYSNILTLLDLCHVPFRAVDRDNSHPLIIGGGSGSFNPEPVADFFDAILLGDGEEAVLELAAAVSSAKREGLERDQVLVRLSRITGMYIPSFFQPQYDAHGQLNSILPLRDDYQKVRRRIIASLDDAAPPQPPLVSLTKIVHDRLGIEIARGCTRGCRFCQAGVIYRPVRERSPARVMQLASEGIAAGGYNELGLLSLSTGDYGCLPELMKELMDTFMPRRVSVSMPSMRVGTLTPEIMAQIQRVRKSGFTIAPEAGTDRLRMVINKGITEEDLLATCESAFRLGWKLIKFYFMIGLPTETIEDVEAIVHLAGKALGNPGAHRGCSITISVSPFVPKPHTPFQWEAQLSIDEARKRIDLLRKKLPRKGFNLKWHDPKQSFLEGVFSRGDRRLAEVIAGAWRAGARLDSWSEHFNLDTWLTAGRAAGVELEAYLQRRAPSQILPWRHLDSCIDLEFLHAELARSLAGDYTPDCRVHGCQGCGVCDFKGLKPIVHRSEKPLSLPQEAVPEQEKTVTAGQPHFSYRIGYSRLGEIRFLGHLELIQVFYRVLQRARVPVVFSQGFNPIPKVSFSPALPVGTESLVEYIDVEIYDSISEAAAFLARLNLQMPAGLQAMSIEFLGDRGGAHGTRQLFDYEITLPRMLSEDEAKKVAEFHGGESFVVGLTRKGKMKEYDVRPLVREFGIGSAGSRILLRLLNESGKTGIKPLELLEAVLQISPEEAMRCRVLKIRRRQDD